MTNFEKLGAFYLGRPTDPDTGETRDEPLLYDSKDLTTHALAVGMTGSGKTGLSIVLLEEAALDGIPALVIDPKGDMGNLMLRFPRLATEDFSDWVDPGEATRRGLTVSELASETAATWQQGLSEWGQTKNRIRELGESAEVALYTPGSTKGRPLAVLEELDAPTEAVRGDDDALRERVVNAVSGLLGLVGIEADPMTSREHVLLSNLLERAWRGGENVTLQGLLHAIQEPPFARLGAFELEAFYPSKDRFALAMKLNNLLASPAFAAWREGESLDIQRLLYTPEGKPRLSILSIAHLSDQERMFFVTMVLNEVIAWMRALPGTGSLRALIHMDEIFGYFPPVAAPPSKAPMLTLLKQARAFGVGVVLATQNPVDLDYKGLANIGTWFLGRLQTARDRDRLIEGLASASATSFDRSRTERILSSLDKRVFWMQNVHEDAPVVFRTRWAMSYLRGPLTLEQIQTLVGASAEPSRTAKKRPPSSREREPGLHGERPVLPSAVSECFLSVPGGVDAVYRPHLLASAEVHYVRARYDTDHWERFDWLAPFDDRGPDWESGDNARVISVSEEPAPGVPFARLPKGASDEKNFARWRKKFLTFLYRERPLVLRRSKTLGLSSDPGETKGDFRARLKHALHEKRDLELEKLRNRYAPKLARIEERIRKAEARIEREAAQYGSKKLDTAIAFGMTLAGALFGRKLGSLSNARRASRTARSVSRASKEREDVERARRDLDAEKAKLDALETELAERTAAVRDEMQLDRLEIEEVTIRLRKSDTNVERFSLAWVPD